MLTSLLIGQASIKQMQSRHKYKFIENQVIKIQDKGFKLKNYILRYMRSKSWVFVKFIKIWSLRLNFKNQMKIQKLTNSKK